MEHVGVSIEDQEIGCDQRSAQQIYAHQYCGLKTSPRLKLEVQPDQSGLGLTLTAGPRGDSATASWFLLMSRLRLSLHPSVASPQQLPMVAILVDLHLGDLRHEWLEIEAITLHELGVLLCA